MYAVLERDARKERREALFLTIGAAAGEVGRLVLADPAITTRIRVAFIDVDFALSSREP